MDGPSYFHSDRIDWNGKSSHRKAHKGINLLRTNGIKFGALCVINDKNVDSPEDLLDFFITLGCTSLGINFQELEGANKLANPITYDMAVSFWRRLFVHWIDNPRLNVREFDQALGWIKLVSNSGDFSREFDPNYIQAIDSWPTVTWDGDVYLLSPELASIEDHAEKSAFCVGNVLQTSLGQIIIDSMTKNYLIEYEMGLVNCHKSCAYYDFCGGGQCSNKYFELRDISGTETNFCRFARQALVDGVVSHLKSL